MKSISIKHSLIFIMVGVLSANIYAREDKSLFLTPYSIQHKFQSGNYLGVNDKLNSCFNQTSLNDYHVVEAEMEFLKLKSAYLSGDKDIKSKILSYQKSNHDALFTNQVQLMLGKVYLAEENLDEAERVFSKIDVDRLSSQDKEEYIINKSILLFNKKEYAKAEEELSVIAAKKSSNRIPALFYLACANYAQGDYSQAEAGFLECRNNDEFALNCDYYLTNINFAEKRYSSALKLGEGILAYVNTPESYIAPLKKICGESAFATGNTQKAIEYLKDYTTLNSDDKRATYTLGVAYYNTQHYAEAIKTFLLLTNTDNEFSQSAYLYLGHSYLKTNDRNGAMFAYEKAMEKNDDMQAKESAMSNYCILLDESNILPFDKKVAIYERYINQFPKSENAKTINGLLAVSYLTTKNYDAALKSVNKIKNPDKELLNAKQIILYNLGAKEFEKGEYSKAKNYFNQAIKVGNYNSNIVAKSYLWRGEVEYLFKNYSGAEKDFKKYISLTKRPDKDSYYSLGYALFMQKRYAEAEKQFNNHIANNSTNKATKADAYNRKGDCLYMMRQYSNARKAYSEAEKSYNLTADYSLYMQGVILGVEKQHNAKVDIMERLVMLYPQSAYAPKAIMEEGNAQIALNQNRKALTSFAKLYDKYPKTDEARKALLQSAIILMNEGDESAATKAYKTLIEEYQGSNEAALAMEDLKNHHLQKGDIEPYAEYVKKIKGEDIYSNAEMDSLTYYAAENLFLKSPGEKSVAQLKNYIGKYPKGVFTSNASFYIAQYGFNNNNFNEARQYFENVLVSKNVILLEESLHSLATIEELDKNYEKSYHYYKSLIEEYPTSQLANEAKSSAVRVLYLDGKNSEVITVASKLLSEGGISNIDEIRYYRAKSYDSNENKAEAIKDWEELSKATHSIYSAEAKYMIAENLFESGNLSQAEESVNNLLSSSTGERYWVARGIILLSDISAKQGDSFKAKQYLNSLKSNYTENDDIQTMIKSREKKYEN